MTNKLSPKVRQDIVRLAQRMLAAQLEINPKAKSDIEFTYRGIRVEVLLTDRREWTAVVRPWDRENQRFSPQEIPI